MRTSTHADEQGHHDAFYGGEAAKIFDSPIFTAVRSRYVERLVTGRPSRPRVLSLGSGDGRFECHAADEVRELVGIELSPVAVEQAQRRAEARGAGHLRFQVGDISSPDVAGLGNEPFDEVWAIAVLHHLPEAQILEVLRTGLKLLRPGGTFLSTDPSSHRLIARLRWLVQGKYDHHHSPDERELDPEHLAALYKQAGFVDVRLEYVDFFLGPLAWVAPQTPRRLTRGLRLLDDALLRIPGVRDAASSFVVRARQPG